MTATPADTYNYDVFEPAPYTASVCDGPRPGDDLGDVDLERLDGARVALGDLADGIVVVETGSVTCPLYQGNVRRMRRVAAAHPEVKFVVLYTREAHPGERRGAHRDMADKRAAAADLPRAADEWRTILVDDIDGTMHRRLEGAPDSVTVLDGGIVRAFFHDADAGAVDAVLRRMRSGRDVVGVAARFAPPAPWIALRALRRGGRRALVDFARGLPALLTYRLRGGQQC